MIIELANDSLADMEYLDKIKDCKGLHKQINLAMPYVPIF
jgi:hypothetical protein